MAKISFKSSGTDQDDPRFSKKAETRPIGIKTPLQIGAIRSGLLEMNFNIVDQINDNFKNLLLTNNGERLGRYSMGADLQPLVTERTSIDDFDSEAMQRITAAVNMSMPFLELLSFETIVNETLDTATGSVTIRITYSVPSMGIRPKGIEVTIETQ